MPSLRTPSARTRKVKKRSATINRAAVLTLKEEGRPETNFHLTAMRSDFGRAYELKKFIAEGGETYHVCMYPDGKHSTCECKGFLRWGKPCRHISSLQALIAAGRMPAFVPM